MRPPVPSAPILTPDQRLRVFVSSTLQELAEERRAAREAIRALHLSPVMFELGARPHPPRALYRSYLAQSHVFVGIYWQRYGWVAPGESVSGLEDEYLLAGALPKLIYVKSPVGQREERLEQLLERIRADDQASYRSFSSAEELGGLLVDDLALLLSERFAATLTAAADPVVERPAGSHEPLPTPPTPLVGRAREMAEVMRLLQRDEVRLVSLVGPGGVGKSRLALEVARRLQERFAAGVAFVPLAHVSDPALLLPTLARTLGVRETSEAALRESLVRWLGARELLLLLDNFEQLVAAAPLLSDLLAAAPGPKLLVTSRSALRISPEHVFEVQPLDVPGSGASPFEVIRSSDAVRLFVERARAVRSDFALTVDNALAVAEITHRLDGLPLALELAAARVNLLTPQALLRRLDRRLELLSSGARDLPDRQKTLRSAIDWSYRLLEEPEQRLFGHLAVFAGGFTLEAAEAVGSDGDADVFALLASLVEKSLVRHLDREPESRFAMLESLREYALERLAEQPAEARTRRRHAEYFLQLARSSEGNHRGNEQVAWLERLEREHDNLRAALGWTLSGAAPDLGVELALALFHFWYYRSFVLEGTQWLERALELSASSDGDELRRARLLSAAGTMANERGDDARALELFEERLERARILGDLEGQAAALNSLGAVVWGQRDYARAQRLIESSLALRRELGQPALLTRALNNLGLVALTQGKITEARAYLDECLAVCRELGDTMGAASALVNLAVVELETGDVARAGALLEESLLDFRALGDQDGLAHCFEGFAGVAALLRQPELAARLAGLAEMLRETTASYRSDADAVWLERRLRPARDALGEGEFEAERQRGRDMTLAEGVVAALALRTTSPESAAVEGGG